VFEQASAPFGAAIRHLGGIRQDRLPGLIPNEDLQESLQPSAISHQLGNTQRHTGRPRSSWAKARRQS
jgi:hypothetical protein